MKLAVVLVLLGTFFISCSSSNKRRRGLASASQCQVEKHNSKDYYRLTVNNQPVNEYWYSEKYATNMLNKYDKKGMCD